MREIGRDRFRKAIGELPEFSCKDEYLWAKVEKELDKRNIISSEFGENMLEFHASEEILENIESPQEKSTLKKAINQLPEHALQIDIWPVVEKELNSTQKQQSKKFYLSLLKVAAVFVLLVGGGLIYRLIVNSNEKDTISYSIEIIDDNTILQMPLNSEGDDHIQAICLNNPVVCSTPEFIELNKQIEDIEKELENISNILLQNNDPQIQRYYYQLENEKVEIEKKIIRVINQS